MCIRDRHCSCIEIDCLTRGRIWQYSKSGLRCNGLYLVYCPAQTGGYNQTHHHAQREMAAIVVSAALYTYFASVAGRPIALFAVSEHYPVRSEHCAEYQ